MKLYGVSGVDSDTLSAGANANPVRPSDGSDPASTGSSYPLLAGNTYGRSRGRALISRCNSGLTPHLKRKAMNILMRGFRQALDDFCNPLFWAGAIIAAGLIFWLNHL